MSRPAARSATAPIGSRLHGPLDSLHGALEGFGLAAVGPVGPFDQLAAPADRPLELLSLGKRCDLDGVGVRDFVGHGRAMPGSTRSHHSQSDVDPFLWIGDPLGGDESASTSAFAARRSLVRSPGLQAFW